MAASQEQIYQALQAADASGNTEDARQLALMYQNTMGVPAANTPEKPAPGFWGSFMESATLLGLADEAAIYAANPSDENREKFLAAGESKYGEPSQFSLEGGLSGNWQALKEMAGGSAGFLVAPAAAATVGALAGGVGAPVAGYGTFAAQYGISNLERQAQEQQAAIDAGQAPQDLALGKAAAAAAGQTALDVAGGRFWGPVLARFPILKNLALGKGTGELGEALEESIKNNALTIRGRFAQGVYRGAKFEIPQEIAQQALERWQAGLSVADGDAAQEYIQAGIGAAFLGGGVGGVHGVFSAPPAPGGTSRGQLAVQANRVAEKIGAELSEAEVSAVVSRMQQAGGVLTDAQIEDIIADPNLIEDVDTELSEEERAAQTAGPREEIPDDTGADLTRAGSSVSARTQPGRPGAEATGAPVLGGVDADRGAISEPGSGERIQPGALRGADINYYGALLDQAIAQIPGGALITGPSRVQLIAEMRKEEAATGKPLTVDALIKGLLTEPVNVEETREQVRSEVEEGEGLKPPAIKAPGEETVSPGRDVQAYEGQRTAREQIDDTQTRQEVGATAARDAAGNIIEPSGQEEGRTGPAVQDQEETEEEAYERLRKESEEKWKREWEAMTPAEQDAAVAAEEAGIAEAENINELSGPDYDEEFTPKEMRGRAGPDLFSGTAAYAAKEASVQAELDAINAQETEAYIAALRRTASYKPTARTAFLRGARTVLGMEGGLTEQELLAIRDADPGFLTRPAVVERGAVVKGEAQPSAVSAKIAEQQGRDFVLGLINQQKPAPVETAQETLAREEAAIEERANLNSRAGRLISETYTRIPGRARMLPAIRAAVVKELKRNPNLDSNEALATGSAQEAVKRATNTVVNRARLSADSRLTAPLKEILASHEDIGTARDTRAASGKVKQFTQEELAAFRAENDARTLLDRGRKTAATNAAVIEQEKITGLERYKKRIEAQRAAAESKRAAAKHADAVARGRAGPEFTLTSQEAVKRRPQTPTAPVTPAATRTSSQRQLDLTAPKLTLSEKISPKWAGVIRGWKKLLIPDVNLDVAVEPSGSEFGHVRYDKGTNTYYLSFAQSTKPTKMLEIIAHEMGHIHEEEVFNRSTPETKAALHNEHAKWLQEQKGRARGEHIKALRGRASALAAGTTDTTPFSEQELSYWGSFTEWYADQTSKWAVSSAKPVSVVEKFFSRLGKALHNFYKTLRGQKYLPTETFSRYMDTASKNLDLTRAVKPSTETKAMSARTRAAANKATMDKKFEISKEYTPRGLFSRVISEFRKGNAEGVVNGITAAYKAGMHKVAMIILPTEDLVRWVGNRLNNPRKIQDMVNAMASFRSKYLVDLEADLREIQTFIREKPKQAAALVEVMYKSTDTQIDASKPNVPIQEGLEESAEELFQLYKDAGPEGQRLYKKILADFRGDFDRLNVLAHQRINEAAISNKNKQLARNNLNRMIAEADKLKIYFPFTRIGEFWFSVGEHGKAGHEFYMFPTADERNIMRDARKAELESEGSLLKDDIDSEDSVQELKKQKGFDPDNLVTSILDALGSGAEVAFIEDQVMQLYIRTLPAGDLRSKIGNRRHGVIGYNTDILNAYGHTRQTNINLETRLTYSKPLRLLVDSARAEITKDFPQSEKDQLRALVNEFGERVERELSSKQRSWWDKFAGGINQGVFYYMLTSPRSALVQMTQVPVVAVPYFTAKYGISATKAMGMLGGNFNLIYDDSNVAKLFAAEKDATTRAAMQKIYAEITRTQEFNATFHSEIRNRQDAGPQNYGDAPGSVARRGMVKAMDVMGYMFQTMESGSRKLVFSAAMKLELEKAKAAGKDITNAKTQADILDASRQVVRDTLFNYTNFNKPRIMTYSPLTRVATQFMTFPIQMTSYLLRNFHTEFTASGISPEERAAAARKFWGTTLMAGVFAGTSGLPFYSLITGLLDAFSDEYDESDDDDPTNPLVTRDSDLWFRMHFIPELVSHMRLSDEQAKLLISTITQGPASAITGWNIGPSVSLDITDMWFHNRGNTSASTREALQDTVYSRLTGPAGGALGQIIAGVDEIQNGHWNRGVEKFMPAILRGPVKNLRLLKEGERTREGAIIRDEEWYTVGKLTGQAMGFSNTEVANIQDNTFKLRAVAAKIKEDRDRIYRQLDQAFRADDDKKIDAVFDDIYEFNQKNWFVPITAVRLLSSLEGRERARAEAILGLTIEDALQPWAYDILESDIE
jgi:hypothetical protein